MKNKLLTSLAVIALTLTFSSVVSAQETLIVSRGNALGVLRGEMLKAEAEPQIPVVALILRDEVAERWRHNNLGPADKTAIHDAAVLAVGTYTGCSGERWKLRGH